jgi:hypothetical protein
MNKMHSRKQRRARLILFSAALCLGPALASPAQSLPPTPPTATAPIAATPITEAPTAAHRAEVTFADGLLTVRANDSSLHQILRSISRRTGMKITGGIADLRVFGDYGPAAPATVLATLTDGTGVNMLLLEGSGAPLELVLTPRGAGATPPAFDTSIPDPNEDPQTPQQQNRANVPPPLRSDRVPQRSPSEREAAQRLQQPNNGSVPPSMPQPLNNVLGSENNTTPTASQIPTTNSVPLDSLPTPSTAVSGPGIVDSTNPPPAGSTTAPATTDAATPTASPNGVKTPEQIYQQLLQMQQQQQQTKPPQ